jgi:hypothetical protein
MARDDAADAPTPIIKLAVEMMASLEPSTAARSQPTRPELWCSRCRRRVDVDFMRGA